MKKRKAERKDRYAREFRVCCAEVIRSVARYFDREKQNKTPLLSVHRSRDRACMATGVSRSAMYRLLNDQTPLLEPGEVEERDRPPQIDEEDVTLVRPAIVQLVLDKKPITLDMILAKLRSNPDHPWQWSRSTLYRVLLRLGFSFRSRKHGYHERLREDPENSVRRARYLQYFFKYEADGRPFVYLDESWISQNMVWSKVWTDGTKETEHEVPPGRGKRWILLAAGGKETGWVIPSWKMWKGSVQSEDYHSEMNQEVFNDWMHRHLMPHIPPNSVIVFDRAPYHKMLAPESRGAKSTLTREELADWLVQHRAVDEDGALLTKEVLLQQEFVVPTERGSRTRRGWSRQALLAKAHECKPKPVYLVHQWIEAFNRQHGTDMKMLMLPIAHPQLNPIETMWSHIKRYVRTNNQQYDLAVIKTLAETMRDTNGQVLWAGSYKRMREFAEQSWRADEELVADPDLDEDNDEEEEREVD